ncbi:MAG: flagellar export chaperone FliS [Acidobacteria bacterium]|nr:flagellar export chaperone FliS [Acidobacteriota bacterium]MBI3470564.1 flagellar export chaperone FliS [Candidatus Solibacter usitatus]
MSPQAHTRYLENQVAGATPLELVEILYHGALDAVRNARRHLQQGDAQGRSREITRAQLILGELAASVDRAKGGSLATDLLRLYAYMQARLAEAHVERRDPPLAEVAGLLATLADGWRQCAASLPAPAVLPDRPDRIAAG